MRIAVHRPDHRTPYSRSGAERWPPKRPSYAYVASSSGFHGQDAAECGICIEARAAPVQARSKTHRSAIGPWWLSDFSSL